MKEGEKMSKKESVNIENIQEINKNYLLKLFDYESLDKRKLIKNLEIGSEGFIIKNLRLYKKLTQKELAKETGISENTIYNYENGKTKPTPNNWGKITKFFNIDKELKNTINIYMFLHTHELEQNKKVAFSRKEDIEKIAENINKFSDKTFREIILPNLIDNRKTSVFDINNLLNAYNISKYNLKYSVEFKNFIEGNEKKSYFIISEKNKKGGLVAYGLSTDEFIDNYLIPLSNFFDYLYKNIGDTKCFDYEGKENIFNNEYKILSDKLEGLKIEFDEEEIAEINFQNKEGGSDE